MLHPVLANSSRSSYTNKNSMRAEWGCQKAIGAACDEHAQALWQVPGMSQPRKEMLLELPTMDMSRQRAVSQAGFLPQRQGQLCDGDNTPVTCHFSFILLLCSSFMCLHKAWASYFVRTPRKTLPNQEGHCGCIQLEPPTVRPTVWGRIRFF